MNRNFSVWKRVYPLPVGSRPFRLIETLETSDGPRTRICAGGWFTEAEAVVEADSRNNRERS
jgi:hypothetical protein